MPGLSDVRKQLEVLAKDPQGFKVMKELVCTTANEELKNMCRRSENSVLRKHGYEDLSDLCWKEVYVELENKCPTTMQFLITLVDGMDIEGKKMAPVSILYSIPMFLRFPEMSRLQRLNTILLTDGGASKMVSNDLFVFVLFNFEFNSLQFSTYQDLGTFYLVGILFPHHPPLPFPFPLFYHLPYLFALY